MLQESWDQLACHKRQLVILLHCNHGHEVLLLLWDALDRIFGNNSHQDNESEHIFHPVKT